MTKFSMLLGFLLGSSSLHAQTMVRGTVKLDDQSPAPFSQITLYRDSNLVRKAAADSAGNYHIVIENPGGYVLEFSLLGYNPHRVPFNITAQHPEQIINGVLTAETNNISQITVTGQRPGIRYEQDRAVVQISGNAFFRSATNTMDVLGKIPGVQAGADGALLVSGRNTPAIFVNGKPMPMSAEESLAYLNSLSPEAVERIEVIANPPAQYDGIYKAIIDIRLKTQPAGFRGNITSAIRQNIYTSADNSLTLNYRTRRVSYGMRAGYVLGNDHYLYNALQQLANTNFMETYTPTRTHQNNLLWQGDVTYEPSANQAIDISLKAYSAVRERDTRNTLTFMEPADRDVIGLTKTTNMAQPRQNTFTAALSYNLTFKNKAKLAFFGTANQVLNRQREDIQIRDQFAGTLTDHWKTTLRNQIAIRNAQADYTAASGGITAGLKVAHVKTENNLRYDVLNGQDFDYDPLRSNIFNYSEAILAGYVSYGYKLNKVEVRLGMRTEYTRTVARSATNADLRERSYFNWLPNLLLSYQPANRHQLRLNVTRRITRPNFDQLNPFRFYFSPLNYWVGNPYLRPSVTTSAALSYNWGTFSITATAGREKDFMTRYPEYNPVTNELLYLGTNLPFSNFANIETGYSFAAARWWRIMQNVVLNYQKQQMPYFGNTFAIPVTDLAFNGSQVFTVGKGFTADLSYRYRTNTGNSLYYIKAIGGVDAGLQKAWLGDRLNTKINVYDLFYTQVTSLTFRERSIMNNQLNHRFGTRRVVLALSYNFGKGTGKTRENRVTDEEKRAGN